MLAKRTGVRGYRAFVAPVRVFGSLDFVRGMEAFNAKRRALAPKPRGVLA